MLKSSLNSRRSSASASVLNRTIVHTKKSSDYSFPKPSVVPAAEYHSIIIGIEESKTKAGAEAVDVLYRLTDATGNTFHVRMRYPTDSYYFEEFCDALLEAGLPDDSTLSKAIGIEEQVELGYPNGERIGSFTKRRPAHSSADGVQRNVSDHRASDYCDDDWDSDFLSDDD